MGASAQKLSGFRRRLFASICEIIGKKGIEKEKPGRAAFCELSGSQKVLTIQTFIVFVGLRL